MLQERFSASDVIVSEGKGGKLTLGRYPYTYARVSFMRSFLLGKDDYHKLMKMDINETISYLESSQYRKEIDELAVKFHGVRLMELALNRNLANTWLKLKRISTANLRVLISAYLLRADIWNIKVIVRANYTKLDPGQLEVMLLPVGFLSGKKLGELAKKESVEDILKAIGFIDYGYFADALDSFRDTKSLSEIETALDRFFYSAMDAFSRRLPGAGRHFREFLEGELETATIMSILRLKRANMAAKDIERFIVAPIPEKSLLRRMIDSPTALDAAKLLEQSRLKAVVGNGVKEFVDNGSLIMLELDLSRRVLKRSALLSHQHPLTIDVILGYMFAKELEVRNLRLMLKAKQLGIGEDFVSQQLITN